MAPLRSPTTISLWMAASNCHSASEAAGPCACGACATSAPANRPEYTAAPIANGSLNRLHLPDSIRKHSQDPAPKVSDLRNILSSIISAEIYQTNPFPLTTQTKKAACGPQN